MPSIRDRIVDALMAAWNSASVVVNGVTVNKPAGLEVQDFPGVPYQGSATTVLRIFPADDLEPQRFASAVGGATRHPAFRVQVHCLARVTTGTVARKALDPLLVWVIQAAMADQSLGGLVIGLREGSTLWDAETFNEQYAEAWQDIVVDYDHLANDPTAG